MDSKHYTTYTINRRADFIFRRAAKLAPIFGGHKASLLHYIARLLEVSMPFLSDENVSDEELLQIYGSFTIAVSPTYKEEVKDE